MKRVAAISLSASLIFSVASLGDTVTNHAAELSLARYVQYSTVRLETVTNQGTNVGTGFFFSFAEDGNGSVPVIITCKHVVQGALTGTFYITPQMANGLPDDRNYTGIMLDNFEKRWIPHPNAQIDLCAMPIAPLLKKLQEQNKRAFITPLVTKLIPSDDEWQEYGPLEKIIMIGYPIGLWDAVNNHPVTRQGIAATDPSLDYNGKQEFVIDAACFPGSSGSPVCVLDEGAFLRKGALMSGKRLRLLGILYGGPEYAADGTIKVVEIPNRWEPRSTMNLPLNLGYVIKAKALLQFEELFKKLMEQQKSKAQPLMPPVLPPGTKIE